MANFYLKNVLSKLTLAVSCCNNDAVSFHCYLVEIIGQSCFGKDLTVCKNVVKLFKKNNSPWPIMQYFAVYIRTQWARCQSPCTNLHKLLEKHYRKTPNITSHHIQAWTVPQLGTATWISIFGSLLASTIQFSVLIGQ